MILFHILINERGELGYSPVPQADMQYADWTAYLSPGLPLSVILQSLDAVKQAAAKTPSDPAGGRNAVKAAIAKRLAQCGASVAPEFIWAARDSAEDNAGDGPVWFWPESLSAGISERIRGRQLADRDIAHLSAKLDVSTKTLVAYLQMASYKQYGAWVPAIEPKPRPRCARCGSEELQAWPSIYGQALTCQSCQALGALSSQSVLYRVLDGSDDSVSAQPCCEPVVDSPLDFSRYTVAFTERQKVIAQKLIQSVLGRQRELLLWAACGAGKTEVCFPLIKTCLDAGQRVLFAAPRQDVVHDVLPRLQKNFPDHTITLHSGATGPVYEAAGLTIATTHQVLKFYRCFDLILLDELDAYPYAESAMLHHGLNTARKEGGRIVYLTATPSAEIIAKVERGGCGLIRLPLRHHGRPLPVPEIIKSKFCITEDESFKSGKYNERDKQSKHGKHDKHVLELKRLLGTLAAHGPVLIFVPVIRMVEPCVTLVQQFFPHSAVSGSWSSDPGRRTKVAQLQTGGFDFFVSTSILERGITIDRVQVVVLAAHHDIYDERTLVQMAGRAGRTPSCPTGTVVFRARVVTRPMKTAIQWIRDQNRAALEEASC